MGVSCLRGCSFSPTRAQGSEAAGPSGDTSLSPPQLPGTYSLCEAHKRCRDSEPPVPLREPGTLVHVRDKPLGTFPHPSPEYVPKSALACS